MKELWRPIGQLANLYQQPLWIASPSLINLDANPLGIAEGYWQDMTGPEEGVWMTTQYDMCQDCWDTVGLPKDAVTHFLIPEGPWTTEEAEALSQGDHPAARRFPYES